jgi:DUF971 family protein
MIWSPALFAKFAVLILTNLTTTEKRRRVVIHRGGLVALMGLILGSNYELQVTLTQVHQLNIYIWEFGKLRCLH